jgi:hypothetical protein
MPVNIQLSKISIASAISSEQSSARNSLLMGVSSVY